MNKFGNGNKTKLVIDTDDLFGETLNPLFEV